MLFCKTCLTYTQHRFIIQETVNHAICGACYVYNFIIFKTPEGGTKVLHARSGIPHVGDLDIDRAQMKALSERNGD